MKDIDDYVLKGLSNIDKHCKRYLLVSDVILHIKRLEGKSPEFVIIELMALLEAGVLNTITVKKD